MSRLFWILAAVMPAVVAAADSYEIEKLERKCTLERESLLRHRNGTPSCEQLDRIYGRPPKTEPVVIVQPAEEKYTDYRWNDGYKQNCLHDKKGNVVSCY